MKITAVAVENLKSKGLELLPDKMELTVRGTIFPDTYGECIGRYDKSTKKCESFFKKDKEAGNTKYFDKYREKCSLVEKHRNLFNFEDGTEKQVIDYYVMYNIEESSKNRPTEIEEHVDNAICMNGHYKSEYELLFACDGATRRIIIEYTSNNIPMYEFIGYLEDEVEEVLSHEADESNPFFTVLSDSEDYFEITMFDEIGMNTDIEIDSASELMAMLVSVRLLSCEFVESKELN